MHKSLTAAPQPDETPGALVWQPDLGDVTDLEWGGPAVRRHLDPHCWIDHAPRWVRGGADLFDELVATVSWRRGERPMYDRIVTVPRLWATRPVTDPELPPVLAGIAATLAARYDHPFDHVGINLYRDGRDSVAWHADRVGRAQANPLVALVSLGTRRPFLLRPMGGGAPSQRFLLGQGDLLVMGGACQHRWVHAVPKVARTGPRISLAFRHGPG